MMPSFGIKLYRGDVVRTLSAYTSADGLKRAIVPVSAFVVSIVMLALSLFSGWWLLGLAFSIPIIGLGIYDSLQTRWTLTRNYPVAARLRWLFYDLRPFLRAYVVEDDLEGKPYSLEARNLVHLRARGENDTHPFGTELDTDSDEYEWLGHSIAPLRRRRQPPASRLADRNVSTLIARQCSTFRP